MFTVKIKKVHEKYKELFPLGSIATVRRFDDTKVRLQILSEVNNTWYSAEDLCRVFSNTTSYGDIFDRVSSNVKLSLSKRLKIAQANVLRYQELLDLGCDYKFYSELLRISKQNVSDLKDQFPFSEGDDYYTVDPDGSIIWSCWDDQSEELHTQEKKYFKTEAEAQNYINNQNK